MQWLLLEVFVALGLAVFIVWFTMGGKRPPAKEAKPRSADAANEERGGPKG